MTLLLGRLTTPSDFDGLWHFDGDFSNAVGGGPAWDWDPTKKADQDGTLGIGGFVDIAPGFVGFSGWPNSSSFFTQLVINAPDSDPFATTSDITVCALVLCPPDTQTYFGQEESLVGTTSGNWTWGLSLRCVLGLGAAVGLVWKYHDGATYRSDYLDAFFAPGQFAFVIVSRSGDDVTAWVNGRNCGTRTLPTSVGIGGATTIDRGGAYLNEGTHAVAELGIKLAAIDDTKAQEWTNQVLGAGFARAA